MNQCEQILEFIREHGSITPKDAERFKPHGCMRLASRINDLKNLGYPITKVMETKKFDDGVSVSYARYYMEEPDEQKILS